MLALDVLAAAALGAGAFLGARRGLWRMVAGGAAVTLGLAAGALACGPLAAASARLGVRYPGDAILGFLVPFGTASVGARYAAGLWLSKRLERTPERNRLMGAAAGVFWILFAAAFLARLGGLDGDRGRREAPFCSWLARYPGALSAATYVRESPTRARWARAVREALDGEAVQSRAARGDHEAREAWSAGRETPPVRPVRLRQP